MSGVNRKVSGSFAPILAVVVGTGCFFGPTAEQKDWMIIEDLSLNHVPKEWFDKIRAGDSYEDALAAFGDIEGVPITKPEHYTERGFGLFKKTMEEFAKRGNVEFYGWYNENNEVMVAVFQGDKIASTWDGETMTMYNMDL